MANELYVTLTASDNEYIKYPCKGWLELFEIGQNGSIIKGVFRGDPNPNDKTPCFSLAAVLVGNPAFVFDNRNVKLRIKN